MKERIKLLESLLKEKIMLLDGATGTSLQNKNITTENFGGSRFFGCNEALVLFSPDVVRDIHKEYLDSGSDIIETNSFGATSLVLSEYGLQDRCYEINKKSAVIARKIADEFTSMSPEKPRFVAGSMGPTTKSLSVTGGITFDELSDNFFEQAKGLYDGGVDYFLVETCNDTRNIKAAIRAIEKFQESVEIEIPVAVSVTFEGNGTMLAGQTPEALIVSMAHLDLLYLGINCATGPAEMAEHLRTLSEMSGTRVACVPNAGFPDENGNYLETPESVAHVLEQFIDKGMINIIGGCCGTSHKHIKAMSKMLVGKRPRIYAQNTKSLLSGMDCLEVTDEKRPMLVGERTNSIGSKKFRTLIADGKFDQAAEIAKMQVKKGAHIVDVCLANPDRDELSDMKQFLGCLVSKIKVPMMIDSTDHNVIEEALKFSQGKAIINSINLEENGKRFKTIVPLARKFGAGLVIGMIDDDLDQGMAIDRKRKLKVAIKSYRILREIYGVEEQDMYFDPLVFPCASGDKKYTGSAIETIEAIKLIKNKFPMSKTVIGLSNVSFGLPLSGREVLNSVFLYHSVQAGLDLAIANTEKIKRFSSISEEEIKMAEDLLWNRGFDPIGKFANHFREKKKDVEINGNDLDVNQRVALYVVEGLKNNLEKDIDQLLQTMRPIEIINGPLMTGMTRVGKLFNSGKLIVAEVLQSAEVMKAAVDCLESKMDQNDLSTKGTFLLATVKGDVHDIGKNLVDIILSNNGYKVINLGIKITSEQLIRAVKKYRPDIIGLSGLLVKSAEQMVLTVNDLADSNINIPIIVGGAALSRNFVDKKISPVYNGGKVFYAKDPMDGLSISNGIVAKREAR